MGATDPWSGGAAHRARPHAGSRGVVPQPAGPPGSTRATRATRAADVLLRHLSGLVVLVLSGLFAVAQGVFHSPVLVVLVLGLASAALAAGWPAVTGIRLTPAVQVVVALTGLGAAVAVTWTDDLSALTLALGIGVCVLIGASLFLGPAPRDRSFAGLVSGAPPSPAGAPPSPAAAPPSSAGTPSSAGAPPAPTRRPGSHVVDEDGPGPLLEMCSGATASLVAAAGSCWAALAGAPAWSALSLAACAVVAAVVLGDQAGRTFRAKSAGALAAGVLCGTVITAIAHLAGNTGVLLPAVLPVVARRLGGQAAVLVLGLATGVAVALAVMLVDALLGDHGRQPTRLGSLARGCAKFLVAVLPVYAMVRVGGV